MRSPKHETSTSNPEVTCISEHGVWLLHNGEEYFFDYVRFPQFKKGTVQHICNIKLTGTTHLRWPDLDVSLSFDLKEKFNEWKKWLLGTDVHSIRKQIGRMLLDSAIFQCIHEARKHTPKDEKGRVQLNRSVHRFIDRCFFKTQAMAIRRLLDEGTYRGAKNETRRRAKSVTSLYCLLDDMEKHAHILTRENILCALGLPYDCQGRRWGSERARNQSSMGADEDQEDRWSSEDVHKDLDLLTGVAASERTPGDRIPESIFQWLKARLKQCRTIQTFVNKYVAHSASPESRATISNREMEVTLQQILEAHKAIYQIAEFVSATFFLTNLCGILPEPRNKFEHFEKSWATKEVIGKLQKWWHDYERTIDEWGAWNWQDEYTAGRSNPGK